MPPALQLQFLGKVNADKDDRLAFNLDCAEQFGRNHAQPLAITNVVDPPGVFRREGPHVERDTGD